MFQTAPWRHGRWLRPVALLLCLSASMAAQKPIVSDMEVPLKAEQTADEIGLMPLFQRIKELKTRTDTSSRLELVEAQQQVMLQVTAASLQVDAASGQIAIEIAAIRELENYLSGRRDSRVDRLNLLNLGIGGTTGTAASALGLTTHDHAAAVIGIIGGVTTAALTFAALRVSRGSSRELMVSSNMLSKVFDHPSDANNVYPPIVVNFMNSIAPDDPDGLSRQDRLIHDWVTVGRIPDPKTKKG